MIFALFLKCQFGKVLTMVEAENKIKVKQECLSNVCIEGIIESKEKEEEIEI